LGGQHAPHFRVHSKRVRQYLEHDVAMAGAVVMSAQSGQAQGVRGVVGRIDAVCVRSGFDRD